MQAFYERGLILHGNPKINCIFRVDVQEKPKGNQDGSALIRADGSGWVQNWTTDDKPTCFWPGSALPKPSEQEKQRREAKRMAAAEQQEQNYKSAAARAKKILESARPASAEHPYLQRKGVGAHGISESNGELVIPIFDAFGAIQSLQFIPQQGNKRFLRNGKAMGGRFLIGGEPDANDLNLKILVCEGYATGWTLNNETGYPVFVAFFAGNLEHVAVSVRSKYLKKRIVICGDNDWEKPINTGVKYAKKAAAHARANVAFPPNLPGVSDFNDWSLYLKNEGVNNERN